MFTLGVDVGGTFTDLVAIDDETSEVRTAKVPSQKGDPGAAIAGGIEELGLADRGIGRLIHGTTVATNALLERRGALTGLVTTTGFRDIVQFNRGRRLAPGGMFDVLFRRPAPLVTRELRLEVDERIRATGEVIVPLDAASVAAAAAQLKSSNVDAVAVCFLHSYAFPGHERAAEAQLREALGPTVYVCCSHDVNPQFREFERFSTTVVNAYVGPVVESYLDDLKEHRQPGLTQPEMHIMGSAGGVLDFETAARYPVRTILSGPAGGVTASRFVGRELGYPNLISCDIGGTSADVALLQGERVFYATETNLSGVTIRAAQLEINTVGAGAGSIIWTDVDGALCVGPHSAGADPGPVCYCKGGTEPTVTDANVVLNRIGDGALLGNRIKVDAARARASLVGIKERLGFRSIEEAADGALQILVARTVRAIREVSVERGFDPRDFALIAFGGAGPMHAVAIADGLGMKTVIVPNHPGNLSAFGLVVASVRRDATQPYFARGASVDLADLRSRLAALAGQVRDLLLGTGVVADSIRVSCSLSMRSVGQAHEILVPAGADPSALTLQDIRTRFDAHYAERYGRDPDPRVDFEVVELYVAADGQVEAFSKDIWRVPGAGATGAPQTRPVWFDGRAFPTPVYARTGLAPGASLDGPLIIEESGATTVLPPGWTATVHATGNIVLQHAP